MEVEVRVEDDVGKWLPDIRDTEASLVVGVASRLNSVKLASVRQRYSVYVVIPSVK